MAHDVFISYATRDKPIADAVCATLEGRRIRCWVAPRDILPGLSWAEAIVAAIEASRILVLVFSADSNSSKYVGREVERAVNHGVVIVPFRVEDVPLSGSLQFFIGSVHWLDALTPPLERHLHRLAENVELLLTLPATGTRAGARGAEGARAPAPERRVTPAPRPTAAPRAPAELAPLSPADCPLYAPAADLLDEYNRLVEGVRGLAQYVPALLTKREVPTCLEILAAVRAALTRDRFRVGLLGPAQVGKSATVNRLLGVSDADGPDPIGHGARTTRVSLRVRALPASAPSALRLHFYTPAQYRAERERLCVLGGIAPERTYDEILRESADRLAMGGSPDARAFALAQLEQLERAFRQHGSVYVTEPARVESKPYAERSDYLCEPARRESPGKSALGPLIREAVVEVPSEAFPGQIELVSYPATMAGFAPASLGQGEDLRELDAVLVFVAADQLHNEAAATALGALQGFAPSWARGRVGLVVTRMDLMTAELLRADTPGPSFGATLQALVGRHELPEAQVYLVANARQPPEAGATPVLERWPWLRSAYAALGHDGGINALRTALTSDVPSRARARLRQQLAQVRQDLAQLLDGERATATARLEDVLRAQDILAAALEQVTQPSSARDVFAAQGQALAVELGRLFARLFSPALQRSYSAARSPAELFAQHSRALEQHLHRLLDTVTLLELPAALGAELDAAPAVPLPGHAASLGEAWRAAWEQDRHSHDWRAGVLPTFLGPTPFANAAGADLGGIDAAAYREIMEEKTRAVAGQAIHALRMRARDRLQGLAEELTLLAQVADNPAAAGVPAAHRDLFTPPEERAP